MTITKINSNGFQSSSYENSVIGDFESDIAHESFNQEYQEAKTENTALFSHPFEWTRDLTDVDVMLMMGEIKGYIAGAGAIFNGIKLSIDDKKAIVSMRVPITISIPPIVEAINDVVASY